MFASACKTGRIADTRNSHAKALQSADALRPFLGRIEDAKAIPSIGTGVIELRVWDEAGTFRVVYVAKFTDAVYVLHCFQKKTQQTAKRDIELAQKRLKDLLKEITP